MQHRVDHEQRRRTLVDALWRIVGTRGLDGVGMREIAKEAGVSLGQLQHYFSSKEELLLVALTQNGERAGARVRQRLQKLGGRATPYRIIRTSLQEMLPLDRASRDGLLVHLAYLSRAVHDDQLRAVTKDATTPLAALFADQLRQAAAEGELTEDRDPETEASLLICLAEGLTNYVLLEVHTPKAAQAMLDGYLATLFTPAARNT
ncbi:TetR/AcrR family transcriptional regulator [Microlunatus sp. GCM10028923]|uniref:TetR/AcrR family transcriptional regulator n=1 Tax=Microlunatus sp. GCM10028923 TaxID=3273400 RepID=UPI003623DA0B